MFPLKMVTFDQEKGLGAFVEGIPPPQKKYNVSKGVGGGGSFFWTKEACYKGLNLIRFKLC